MVLSPSGQQAYLAFAPAQTNLTTINVYAVSSTGRLAGPAEQFCYRRLRLFIVMHPSGGFLYGYNGGDILIFPLDSVGNLQTPNVATGVSASGLYR